MKVTSSLDSKSGSPLAFLPVPEHIRHNGGFDQLTDYDLSRLSSRSFEQLLQALAIKVLGPGLGIFGDGPDGGREATFHGKVPYPYIENSWDGYGVVQAKFRQRSGNVKEDGDWVVTQLKAEVDKYFDSESNLRKPDYFIYATNVVLTPVKGKGSKDRVEAVLEGFKDRLPLKGYDVWDYDKIRVFLDDNQEVRRTYAAWITSGDVLSAILEQLTSKAPNFEAILSNFLQKELLSDEFVNLELAGHDVNERISLARVFVDLPVVDEQYEAGTFEIGNSSEHLFEGHVPDFEDGYFIKGMLAVAAECLDPKSLSAHAIGQSPKPRESSPTRGRFVLIGGPGQGKSTVGQFICQIFRASILSRRPKALLSAETSRALSLIESHCQEEDIDFALVPRFPFRIVLNEFASTLSSDAFPEINSVLSFLSHQIHKRTGGEVSINDLQNWFAHYPSLIIFDGLDEVPSSSNRDQVLEAIRDFWIDVNSVNADILSIATSRPQGYNEDFSPSLYRHQRLAPLSKKLGKHFAQRLVDVKYGSDLDRKEKVLTRLDRSFESEATSRLMRSPLQVTIMTALVDQRGQPPQARWNLFKAYYDVIYQREVERDIPASAILRQYQPDINAIHSRVGLLLQIDSEQTGRTDAKFSTERFVSLVKGRLKEEGHEGEGLSDLAQQILDAAAERLVFLVGLESDQVGFEIRSLQEFMAAEGLMEGNDEDVQRRLLEIAPLPNWRNVFLFASGKCFAERQHLRQTIHSICAVLNETNEDAIAGSYLAGSGLAMDLLDDGLTRHQPRFVQSLARIAMRALDVPNNSSHIQLANVYEQQLESVYVEEMAWRLRDKREIVRLATWNSLIRLVAGGVNWARQLADEHWPTEPEAGMKILSASVGFWRNLWSAAKFLELMPQYSVARLRRLFHIGTTRTIYEEDISYRMAVTSPQGLNLLPHQEAMIRVLRSDDYDAMLEFDFLGDRAFGISALKAPDHESSWFSQLRDLQNCHPTWLVYKSAAEFLQNPSKETLARELRAIAQLMNSEALDGNFGWYSQIPWPMLACLNMCKSEKDVLKIAHKVESGKLGDRDCWLAAERRWRKTGIGENDIKSMSEDRLPFDGQIDTVGFPITLPIWPALRLFSEDLAAFNKLLSLFEEMEKSETRVLIAGLIEMCFVSASMFIIPEEDNSPVRLNVATLQSIYEDLPPGRSVPLHAIVNQFSGVDQEIADLFHFLRSRQVEFEVYSIRRIFRRDGLDQLRNAFWGEANSESLVPIFGLLAEHGQLPPKFIDVPDSAAFEGSDHKVASFIILLANESWDVDRTDLLMGLIEATKQFTSPNEIYGKILNTLEENRSSGRWLEKFLLELGKLLPTDNYELRKRYMQLLHNGLRRRISRLADPAMRSNFNMPRGITELL